MPDLARISRLLADALPAPQRPIARQRRTRGRHRDRRGARQDRGYDDCSPASPTTRKRGVRPQAAAATADEADAQRAAVTSDVPTRAGYLTNATQSGQRGSRVLFTGAANQYRQSGHWRFTMPGGGSQG
jgi:hypothetical protein